jgi:hypothetical protein
MNVAGTFTVSPTFLILSKQSKTVGFQKLDCYGYVLINTIILYPEIPYA